MNLRQTISSLVALLATAASLSSCGSTTATHLLYVSTGQGIYAYRIDNKTGASTLLPAAPFLVGNTPAGMVLDPSGKHAYVANQRDNTISLLDVDAVSGSLTEVLPRTSVSGFSPDQLLLDSAGTTLFAASLLSNSVSTFSIGTNGALTQVATANVFSQPSNMAFAGGLLFVGVPNFSRVYVFGVSAGTLTPVSGSPLIVTDGVGNVTVDPAAKFLYVTNPSNNTISGFAIQYSGGANTIASSLIPGSPFAATTISGSSAPKAPISSVLDSTATHLYVANSGSASVSTFSVGTNGQLTALTTTAASVGSSPLLFAFDPVAKYLFVGNVGSNSITELTIRSDASLTTNGQSVSLPSVPQAIVLSK